MHTRFISLFFALALASSASAQVKNNWSDIDMTGVTTFDFHTAPLVANSLSAATGSDLVLSGGSSGTALTLAKSPGDGTSLTASLNGVLTIGGGTGTYVDYLLKINGWAANTRDAGIGLTSQSGGGSPLVDFINGDTPSGKGRIGRNPSDGRSALFVGTGGDTPNGFQIGTRDGTALQLFTNDNSRVFVTSGGSFGIGAFTNGSPPTSLLHVLGNATITGDTALTSATNSTGTTSGALQVTGGVGVQGAIFGGSLNSATINATGTLNLKTGGNSTLVVQSSGNDTYFDAPVTGNGSIYIRTLGSGSIVIKGQNNTAATFTGANTSLAGNVTVSGAVLSATALTMATHGTATNLDSIVGTPLANVTITGGSSGAMLTLGQGANANLAATLGSTPLVKVNNSTTNYTVALGYGASAANTTANYNTAVGYNALTAATSGGENTAIGAVVLSRTTTGVQNVGIGSDALAFNTTGNYNTSVGWSSLLNNTTGTDNAAGGFTSLNANTTGSYNAAWGDASLLGNTSGDHNTAIGYSAGGSVTTGTYNTFIGAGASAASGTVTKAIAIGANAVVGASNSAVLGGANGTADAVNVGIGTLTPAYPLSVVGNGYISGSVAIGATATTAARLAVVGGNIALDDGAKVYWAGSTNAFLSISSNVATLQAFSSLQFSTWNGSAYVPALTISNTSLAAVLAGGLTAQRYVTNAQTTTYSATTNLDATNGMQTVSLTGNVTFTTSNLVNGERMFVRIVSDGSSRTLTFPGGWTFIGASAPASIAASKTALLKLTSFGTTDSSVVAEYTVQP